MRKRKPLTLSLEDQLELLLMTDKPAVQTTPLHRSKKLTLRDEANAITVFAFRNSFLEDLHPRISDEEMRKLMIETSAKVARWLFLRELLVESPADYHAFLESVIRTWCPEWDREATHVPLETSPGADEDG